MIRPKMAVVLGVALIGVGACSGGGGKENSEGPRATEAAEQCESTVPGSSLKMGVAVELQGGFDTTASGTLGIAGGHERTAVFDALMKYDEKSAAFVPWMAESVEPNSDRTEWTLTLKDGIEFGTGKPLDTAAVEFAISRHAAADSKSQIAPQARLIEKTEIVDERTMVFKLGEPWGSFPAFLAGPAGMPYDPAAFKKLGAEAFATNPGDAGAGPYRVDTYQPGEKLTLKAKDDYWGGPVCTESLTFTPVPNEEALSDAFANGEFDVAYVRTPTAVDKIRKKGFNSHSVLSYGGLTTVINQNAGKPGADVRVRKAIAHALDTKVLNERAFDGLGIPSSSLLSKDSELFSKSVVGPSFDPKEAKSLLADAKADGFNGKLNFSCYNDTTSRIDWAITVQASLESVGFDVQLDNAKTGPDNVGAYLNGDFDVLCFGMNVIDTSAWASLTGTLDPGRPDGFKSESMAVAMAKLKAAYTVEELRTAMSEVQSVWNEEVPRAITTHTEEAAFFSDDVRNLGFTHSGILLFDQAVAK